MGKSRRSFSITKSYKYECERCSDSQNYGIKFTVGDSREIQKRKKALNKNVKRLFAVVILVQES